MQGENLTSAIAPLLRWCAEDPANGRRFSIEYHGEVRSAPNRASMWTGGWRVALWTTRVRKRIRTCYVSGELDTAVQNALKGFKS